MSPDTLMFKLVTPGTVTIPLPAIEYEILPPTSLSTVEFCTAGDRSMSSVNQFTPTDMSPEAKPIWPFTSTPNLKAPVSKFTEPVRDAFTSSWINDANLPSFEISQPLSNCSPGNTWISLYTTKASPADSGFSNDGITATPSNDEYATSVLVSLIGNDAFIIGSFCKSRP